MSDELGRALRELPGPDPAAEERAWRIAHAAYVRRPPAPAPRRASRGRVAVPVAAGAVALALAAALTPAGGDVVDLIRPEPAKRPAPARAPARVERLPGGGRLLVVRDGWASVVQGGAAARRLARADEATFSAFGRYVAAARGHRLAVYALDGRRVWSLTEPARVSDLRWAPDGLRIAYRAGSRLRLVDGNGERPRTLGPAAAGLLAWRPGPEPVLAHVLPSGPAALTDVATRTDIARVRVPAGTTALAWSSDGRRLAAVGPGEIRLFSPGGALLARRSAKHGERFAAAAFAPGTHRLATVVRSATGDTLRFRGSVLARARRLGTPAWSPNGRWVLTPAGHDRWTFATGDGRTITAPARGAVAPGGWSSAPTP